MIYLIFSLIIRFFSIKFETNIKKGDDDMKVITGPVTENQQVRTGGNCCNGCVSGKPTKTN